SLPPHRHRGRARGRSDFGRMAPHHRYRRGLLLQARRRTPPDLPRGRDARRALRCASRGARCGDRHRPGGEGYAHGHQAGAPQLGGTALVRPRPLAGHRIRPIRARIFLARGPGRLRHPDRPRGRQTRRRAGPRRGPAGLPEQPGSGLARAWTVFQHRAGFQQGAAVRATLSDTDIRTPPCAGPLDQRTWFGHPRGLSILFLTEMWQEFSLFGMRTMLVYYMTQQLLLSQRTSSLIYGLYNSLAYFTPLIG